MTLPPHVLHISAQQQTRTALLAAYRHSGAPFTWSSLSSASNALLYLNGLGPFKGALRPRLILCDVNLPCAEGTDFLAVLRTNTRFRTIGTGALTVTSTAGDLGHERTLGVDFFCRTPQSPDDAAEIIAVIGAWMVRADTERG